MRTLLRKNKWECLELRNLQCNTAVLEEGHGRDKGTDRREVRTILSGSRQNLLMDKYKGKSIKGSLQLNFSLGLLDKNVIMKSRKKNMEKERLELRQEKRIITLLAILQINRWYRKHRHWKLVQWLALVFSWILILILHQCITKQRMIV